MILVHALIAVPVTDITAARRKWMDENSEYVQLNRRNGKLLLDVLIPRIKLVTLLERIPTIKLVCAWNSATGKRMKGKILDLVEYLDAAEDETVDDGQGGITTRRPVAYRQTMQWLGHPPYAEDEEDEEPTEE